LRILLRFADAAGLVRSVGDVGRGVEKHPLRSPSIALVAGATRRNTLVARLWALGGDRRPRLLDVNCFSQTGRPRRRGGATSEGRATGTQSRRGWDAMVAEGSALPHLPPSLL